MKIEKIGSKYRIRPMINGKRHCITLDHKPTQREVSQIIEEMKSTSLNVPITNMPSSPEPVVGDTVEITYNGKITTTTPEGGVDIYSISSADIMHMEVKR